MITHIGPCALENAKEAGHIILADMGDPNEFYVMRPTHADLENMIQTVTSFGTVVYSFPPTAAEPTAETVSTESEPK